MGRHEIDYLMLEPFTLKVKGTVKAKQVMDDLGISRRKFETFVEFGKKYKGCILVEDRI